MILHAIKQMSAANPTTEDIPLPVASRQIYALDDLAEFIAVLDTLCLTVENAAAWVARFAEQALIPVHAGLNEAAWEGIELNGVFYAWSGPLLDLADREGAPVPPGLLDGITGRGLAPRWANLNNLADHVERGLSQVFATDRRTWRRPLTDRGRVLMVGARRPQ